MNISIIGLGYVGLATAAVLANWGHRVNCIDKDENKIKLLAHGVVPIYEPDLDMLIAENLKVGRLVFYSSLDDALAKSQVIFLAVQTPICPSTGEADLSFLFNAAAEVAGTLSESAVIIVKSTAPPGSIAHLRTIFDKIPFNCPIVINPEFLREGSAIRDMLEPDRIIIGCDDPEARRILADLYRRFSAKILYTSPESAALIKYASNAFLAMKISFVNVLARLCAECDADIDEVSAGVGLDSRIGRAFLKAGLGYGGSCFPKDVAGLIHWSQALGYDFALLKTVAEINQSQIFYVNAAILKLVGESQREKSLALLGLTFKPNTDDIRESPALKLAHILNSQGYILTGYDPKGMARVAETAPFIKLCPDAVNACQNVDAILLLTEWDEFAQLDYDLLGQVVKEKILFDARNLLKPDTLRQNGWTYWSVGRP